MDACTRRVHITESGKTYNDIIRLNNADGDGDDDICVAGTNSTSDDGHGNRPPADTRRAQQCEVTLAIEEGSRLVDVIANELNERGAFYGILLPDDAPPLLDKPSTFPAHVSTALEKSLQFELNEGARNVRNVSYSQRTNILCRPATKNAPPSPGPTSPPPGSPAPTPQRHPPILRPRHDPKGPPTSKTNSRRFKRRYLPPHGTPPPTSAAKKPSKLDLSIDSMISYMGG
ncbi:hypothetical protein M422DRAFT_257649 [Sphaerobolus stellatus SS14]|uniref:Uncharacterized protein n=1 Tax=Sphaerobolus stellatus (strain SS14) TaxID=990650 RepID=A0A0C9UXG8_SPHS4|nr:hypothetical protein M422DRAFT_257649 [Sphaerobolus stellatus SS14]